RRREGGAELVALAERAPDPVHQRLVHLTDPPHHPQRHAEPPAAGLGLAEPRRVRAGRALNLVDRHATSWRGRRVAVHYLVSWPVSAIPIPSPIIDVPPIAPSALPRRGDPANHSRARPAASAQTESQSSPSATAK